MDERLAVTGIREDVAGRGWRRWAFGLSESLPCRSIRRQVNARPVAGVNVVASAFTGRKNRVDHDDVIVLQHHVMMWLLFDGNRGLLSCTDGEQEKQTKRAEEMRFKHRILKAARLAAVRIGMPQEPDGL